MFQTAKASALFRDNQHAVFPTIIGKSVELCTTIVTTESIRVDGRIIGKIELLGKDDLVVVVAYSGKVRGIIDAPNVLIHGEIEGDIYARDVLVDGVVKGNIHATGEVVLMPNALVMGDVIYNKMSIQSGAELAGIIKSAGPVLLSADKVQ
jgi:cytoskeletal protein CcmA (bactofilin family)